MWQWYLNCGGGADDNWLDEHGNVQQSITYASSEEKTMSKRPLKHQTGSISGISSELKSSGMVQSSSGASKPTTGKALTSFPNIITVRSKSGNGSINSSVKKIIIAKRVLSSKGRPGSMFMSFVNTNSGLDQMSSTKNTSAADVNKTESSSASKPLNDSDSDSDEPVIEKIEYLPVDKNQTTPIMIQSDSESEQPEVDEDDFSDDVCITSSEDEDEDKCCEICNLEFSVADGGREQQGWWVHCKKSCGAWVHSKCIGWTDNMVGSRTYQCTQCSEGEEAAIVL